MLKEIKETAEFLKTGIKGRPTKAIILGSGLGDLVKSIVTERVWPYAEIPHFPVSTVEGHAGKLIYGRLSGIEVLVMDGRIHYYEGYTMQEVTFPIRVFGEMGINTLYVSNAAGGTNPAFSAGDLMVITDHINFLPEHPLRGHNIPPGPRFLDMHDAYSPELIRRADTIAADMGFTLRHGIYLANSGPTYETPAEYRMYRLLGADAVGMSTVPEVIVAHHQGIKVFGMSVITNVPSNPNSGPTTHAEVEAVAAKAGEKMSALFKRMINE